MLSLLFWNATVSSVDKWRTTDQAWWPSRLMKATGQHQAPIPAPSRDYCGGILLKISKKCLNGLCVNQPGPLGVKPGRCCPGSREHRGKSLQVDLSGLLVDSISLILGCEAVASCPTIESSHATGVCFDSIFRSYCSDIASAICYWFRSVSLWPMSTECLLTAKHGREGD